MLRDFARKLAAPVLKRIDARIDTKVSQALQNRVPAVPEEAQAHTAWSPELEATLERRIDEAVHKRLFLPSFPPLFDAAHTFMRYSTCSAADFLHPQFGELCREFDYPPSYHRKLWEWVFVIHHLKRAGVLRPGSRGVGFGVGRERLPALFAKYGAQVVATDASEELGKSVGWIKSNEHSSGVSQLLYPSIVDSDVVRRNVTHQTCDMNRINEDLKDFDFTWSCCCFEHLGTLEAGIEFVINSVEKTLKIGGIACHTTEFNLSSDVDTLREGATVLYRKRDMLELVERLRARGHEVETFSVAPDSHYLDGYVDVPPYTDKPHIKLALMGYTTTSVGIVVKRGR